MYTLRSPDSRCWPDNLVAHTPPDGGDWHYLLPHLHRVSELAASAAAKWGAAEYGRILGLTHDLGKAAQAFQLYLRAAARNEHLASSPHSPPGAAAVAELIGPLALCVLGHHAGLLDPSTAKARLAQADPDAVAEAKRLAAHLRIGRPDAAPPAGGPHVIEHFLRMCFSALVDADYLDTEEHFSPGSERGAYPGIAWYRDALNDRIAQFADAETDVVRTRREVQAACRARSSDPQGFFRLTVPTGGGKTLASLQFALEHAVTHRLDRVIVAIPYTSIIEQTADVYGAIFGRDNVLEHHSGRDLLAVRERDRAAVDEDEAQDHRNNRLRLAAENWDCPLIVTTNVQLFESLFANRPSRCRKLHNIARSVVVLDEAQTLPIDLLESCLDVLGWMVSYASASVVLCTATQPDYQNIPRVPDSLSHAREIAPDPTRLFERLRRVSYRHLGKLTHEQVAARVRESSQVLCILNTRKDSVKVFEALGDPNALYLSTLLVPEHRRAILKEVRRRLDVGEPCRLISTQVVEAGVDVDFPHVMRAMGPMDSIVQAAGRCNRSGLLPELGVCEIFDLEGGSSPQGAYATAISVAGRFVPSELACIDLPETQAAYYRAVFEGTATDRRVREGGGGRWLQDMRAQCDFPAVAKHARLIGDDTLPVHVVAYAPEAVAIELAKAARGAKLGGVLRRLAPYSVSLYLHDVRNSMSAGLIEAHETGLLLWRGFYDKQVGIAKGAVADPSDLQA